MAGPDSIEEYMAALSAEQRAVMEQIRDAIRSAAPDASEAFSYRIPTFKQNGRSLVWYAAFKDHYSLYPYTEGLLAALGDELKPHSSGKGTLRFDVNQPIPTDLIQRIVKVRLTELDATYGRRRP
jgi:uncharacterized protein YdhG (YjbR/CyaY superfamily)